MSSVIPSCPVLLVEDDESFRKGLVVALDKAHFAVTMAENGETAIRELESHEFQVIILDLNLPGISGLEIIDYLRQRRESADGQQAKLIVVTAADPTVRETVDLKVAEEVLMKPVDFEYIVKRARRYCGHEA